MPIQTQPFYPYTKIKDVEATSIKVLIHKKKIVEQLVFSKDILCLLKEVR